MAVAEKSGCKWYSIRSRQTCPICGSTKGRCGFMTNEKDEVVLYRCKYKQSSRPSSDGWYIHLVSELNGSATHTSDVKNIINISDYKKEPITEELLTLWNSVYRKFRECMFTLNGKYLYDEHLQSLLSRGLSIKEISEIGCFSVPRNEVVSYKNYNCKLKTAIINELLQHFKADDIIRVPGFSKATYNGKEYITFKNNMDAFFIPYYDSKNRLVGMQYRLTTPMQDKKGKKIRYLWYSSEASCGSPIDYFVPTNLNHKFDNAILVSEGALKAKIAGLKLGIRSLAEAGVTNYRQLVKTLQKIEAEEGKKYNILLALDMDKYTNNDVISAEINTVSLLKSLGYSVTILEWNVEEGKGIDDKLIVSTSGFRFLTV